MYRQKRMCVQLGATSIVSKATIFDFLKNKMVIIVLTLCPLGHFMILFCHLLFLFFVVLFSKSTISKQLIL